MTATAVTRRARTAAARARPRERLGADYTQEGARSSRPPLPPRRDRGAGGLRRGRHRRRGCRLGSDRGRWQRHAERRAGGVAPERRPERQHRPEAGTDRGHPPRRRGRELWPPARTAALARAGTGRISPPCGRSSTRPICASSTSSAPSAIRAARPSRRSASGFDALPIGADPKHRALLAQFRFRFEQLLHAGSLIEPKSAARLGDFGEDGCAPVRAAAPGGS
jgi:hypothetical protein